MQSRGYAATSEPINSKLARWTDTCGLVVTGGADLSVFTACSPSSPARYGSLAVLYFWSARGPWNRILALGRELLIPVQRAHRWALGAFEGAADGELTLGWAFD